MQCGGGACLVFWPGRRGSSASSDFARSVLLSFNGFELLVITDARRSEECWNRDH
jgi:hypothetical protein